MRNRKIFQKYLYGTLIMKVETPCFTLLKLIPTISVHDPGITINIFDLTEYTNTNMNNLKVIAVLD